MATPPDHDPSAPTVADPHAHTRRADVDPGSAPTITDRERVAGSETLAAKRRAAGGLAAPQALPTVDVATYAIESEIAHGGMGRIRAAIDLRLGREVAIKELLDPRGPLGPRFEREALVTARLQHPGIVAVYEAGRWPSGEPFYAMRLVRGRSLAHVITDATTFDARLALLPHAIAVADALAYAHEHRIVHRDLKPANVLVGDFGETVVIDWGLAKDLATDVADASSSGRRTSDGDLTIVGDVMGTPSYMPPEQARGESVDERADVYAIGAMLYHLLAGVAPYAASGSRDVVARVIAEPPEPLQTRIAAIAPDLLAIIERAMARTPAERYRTARELADELRRFQTGQLVASHRYTRSQLVRRFVRRHRIALAIGSVAVLVCAGVAAVAVRQIVSERDEAERARDDAERERATAERARAAAVAGADALLVEQAAVVIERDPADALAKLAQLSPGTAQLAAARVIAADARARHIPRVVRDVDDIIAIAVSPDSRNLAIASGDHAVHLLDLETLATRVVTRHGDRVRLVAFAPDGRSFASLARDDTTVRVTDLGSGGTSALVHACQPEHVALLANARAVTNCGGVVRLWDVATATVTREWRDDKAFELDVTSEGLPWWRSGDAIVIVDPAAGTPRQLAIGNWTTVEVGGGPGSPLVGVLHENGLPLVIERATGRAVFRGRTPLRDITMIPGALLGIDARQVLAAWPLDGTSPREIGTVDATPHALLGVIATTDGATAVTWGTSVQMWNIRSRTETRIPLQHALALKLAPDGARLIVATEHEIRIVPTHADDRSEHIGPVRQVGYRGTELVTASPDGAVTLGTRTYAVGVPIAGRVALHGGAIAALGTDGRVRILDTATGASRMLAGDLAGTRKSPADPSVTTIVKDTHGPTTQVSILLRRMVRELRDDRGWFDPLVFAPDGATLVGAAMSGGVIHVWRVATGDHRTLDAGQTDIEQLAITPDSQTLLAAGSDHRVHVFAIATGAHRVFAGHDGPVEAIAISPDGRAVATASVDHTVRRWDLQTGVSQVVVRHASTVSVLAWSGRWIVSGDGDNLVKRYDVISGETATFAGHTGKLVAVALAPPALVTADSAGEVWLWDLAGGRGRALARAPSGIVGQLAFGPRSEIAGALDDRVQIWIDDLPHDESGLRAWIHAQITPSQ